MTLFSVISSKNCFEYFSSPFPMFRQFDNLILIWKRSASWKEVVYSVLSLAELHTVFIVCDPNIKGAPKFYCLYMWASVPHIFVQSWNMPKWNPLYIFDHVAFHFSICAVYLVICLIFTWRFCGSVSNCRLVQHECFEYLFLALYL